MKIQANATGTRSIEVTDCHLETIKKYSLFDNLVDCTGVVDENTLNRLRLTVRSLLDSQAEIDRDLLYLCLDVIYNSDMKTLGLCNLIDLYRQASADDVKE